MRRRELANSRRGHPRLAHSQGLRRHFLERDEAVRKRLGEGYFAQELGQVHDAHIMGDVRVDLRHAKNEERSAVRARAHRHMDT